MQKRRFLRASAVNHRGLRCLRQAAGDVRAQGLGRRPALGAGVEAERRQPDRRAVGHFRRELDVNARARRVALELPVIKLDRRGVADEAEHRSPRHNGTPGTYHWHLSDVKRLKRPRKAKRMPQPVWFTPF